MMWMVHPRTLTRRSFLQHASFLLGATMVPLTAAAAIAGTNAETKSAKSVIDILVAYMGEAGNRPLPAPVVEKTKQHILDTLAAMISGRELPPGKLALRFAQNYKGEQISTVVGSSILCGPIEAALANGMLAHSDETDDSHAPSHSHPGCGIIPAALAVGEKFGIDGNRFLRSVALGYDIGTRVLMTLGGLPFQMESHRSAHSIANNFGAGAAAGCAAILSNRQMRWVLDYAAQQSSGIAAWQRDTEHIEKSLVFGGFPARNGVSAALLIHLGANGVDDIFSGPDNFIEAFAPKAASEGLIDKLGERYEVTRTNIKKWTVGSPIQAPLDALESIIKKHQVEAVQVRQVTVRVATSEAKTVNNRDMPNISLQHMLAVMLLDKTVSFRAAHDTARMKDPAILRERAKIQLAPDEGLERLYPRREAIVEVALRDGTSFSERAGAVRGTAENPMTREEVISKCRDLMTPSLGSGPCNKLIEAVFQLENAKDIRVLRPLLQPS